MAVAPHVNPEPVAVWLARDRAGALQLAVHEALYEAGALARRIGAPLVALADGLPDSAEQALLAAWGVQSVRALGAALAPHPRIAAGRSGLAAVQQPGPLKVVVFPEDTQGRVLAPLWAAETGAVLVTAASSLTSDGERFVVARPTLGGQYEALVTLPLAARLVVTLTPGAIGEGLRPPAGNGVGRALSIESAPAADAAQDGPPRILAPQPETLALQDAERIVAFGRGAFSPAAVALVEKLATLLGAVVAGSRPAADEGWLPFSRQVGLTGAVVRPRLYVAVGISGAPYHMVGVKDPELLIAINSDPDAPIFGSAHLGLVGDLHAILPALIARLEAGQPLVPDQSTLVASGSVG